MEIKILKAVLDTCRRLPTSSKYLNSAVVFVLISKKVGFDKNPSSLIKIINDDNLLCS